jgi:hypothetical protein
MSSGKTRKRKAEKPLSIYQLSWTWVARRKWPHLRVIAPYFDYALQEFRKAQAIKDASLSWWER